MQGGYAEVFVADVRWRNGCHRQDVRVSFKDYCCFFP